MRQLWVEWGDAVPDHIRLESQATSHCRIPTLTGSPPAIRYSLFSYAMVVPSMTATVTLHGSRSYEVFHAPR